MRKHHLYTLLLVSSFLAMFLLCGCGGTDQHANATATAATPSESLVLETSKTLNLVRASDRSTLWSLLVSGLDQPLAVADHRVYYSNDSIIAAVDLTSGRQIWSTPITIGVSDIQVSGKMVYVLNSMPSDTLLSAFDVTSGTLKWHDDLGYSPNNNQIFLSNQTIYTAISGVFTALDATTGSEQWHFVPPILNDSPPPDVVSFDLSADHSMLVLSYGEALYGVHPDSHQQAWQLAPTSPDAVGSPSYDMLLSWFKLTPDDHILLSASFHATSSFLAPQFEYRYLALSTGSQVWSLSLPAQEQATKEGSGQAFLVGSSAFYAIGGPSRRYLSHDVEYSEARMEGAQFWQLWEPLSACSRRFASLWGWNTDCP